MDALPAVAALEMLRYHTFTAGAGWAYDYGTANDNREIFESLKGQPLAPLFSHIVNHNTIYRPIIRFIAGQ